MSFLQDLNLALIGAVELLDNCRSILNDKIRILLRNSSRSVSNDGAITRVQNGSLAIVTGSNQGVGFYTASELTKRGYTVVLACRSLERAEIAAQKILSLAGKVEIQQLDLASLDSVRTFATKFKKGRRKLDLLVCNAGIMAPPERIETKDGFELQFQTNYLAHWLLAKELLGSLSDNGRIVFLTSLTHAAGRLGDFSDMQAKKHYNAFGQYANTKLCTLLAAREFNRRLTSNSNNKRCAVAVHPGIANTYLARTYFLNEIPEILRRVVQPLLLKIVFPTFLRSPIAAAETVVYACSAPAEEVAGQYVKDNGVSKCANNNEKLAEELWVYTSRLVGAQE